MLKVDWDSKAIKTWISDICHVPNTFTCNSIPFHNLY